MCIFGGKVKIVIVLGKIDIILYMVFFGIIFLEVYMELEVRKKDWENVNMI